MNNGAQVLDQTHAFLARFCTFPSDAALDIAVCWIAHTHVRDTTDHLAFSSSPRIAFVSDKPASGKSKALEMVTRLSFRGSQVLDPTPATFAQMMSDDRATASIDEIDVLFGRGAGKATLRSLLNGGYRQGAKWGRANKPAVSIFGPVALAGLSSRFLAAPELEPLRTRSVIIQMVPATPGEAYRERWHGPMTIATRDALGAWAKRKHALITECWPEDIPEGINDRLLEVCEPLFQVADAAGGRWPEAIRDAAREILLGEVESDEPSLTDSLLISLRQVFADRDKLATVELVDSLREQADAPWAKLWPNESSAPMELAGMLSPLGVGPVRVRFGEMTVRGYRRADLEPLWDELDEIEQLSVAGVAPVAGVAASIDT